MDLLNLFRRHHIPLREAAAAAAAAAAATEAHGTPPENERKRAVRKRHRSATASAPLLPGAFQSSELAPAADVTPRVMDLATMARDFPHLVQGLGRPAPAEGSAAAEAASAGAVVAQEAAVVPAWLSEAFTNMVRDLPDVRLLSPDAPASTALEWLKQRQVALPVFDSAHEDELLKEAGSFRVGNKLIHFPACRQGQLCATRSHHIPGLFDVRQTPLLTQIMFPDELRALLEDGTPPLEHRMCVLCCRLHTHRFVLSVRFFADNVSIQPDHIVQLYRNLVGQPGGFRPELCILPTPGRWEGFVDPIAMFRPHLLHWVQDPANGRWGLDQSLMLFRPAIVPRPGDMEPIPNEDPQTYRLRTEGLLRGAMRHIELHPVQRLLERLAPPRLRARLFGPDPPHVWVKKTQRRIAYESAVLADAYQLGAQKRLAFESVVCEDRVLWPECHQALLRSSLWVAATGVSGGFQRASQDTNWVTALAHIISKSAPYRCMTRKFPSVCVELLARHKELDERMKQWVLCSLLGNWREVYRRGWRTPPSPLVRRRLYRLVILDGWARFKERMSSILVFVVREMVVAEVEACPALRRNLESRLNWTAFAAAVGFTMANLRTIIHYAVGCTNDWPAAAMVNATIDTGHDAVLAVAQQRPTRSLPSFVLGQAMAAAMASLPPLGDDVLRVIREWTQALPPGPAELGSQLVPWLSAFGVDDDAVRAYWRLCCDHAHAAPAKHVLQDTLTLIASVHPRATAVVYAWCKAYTEAQLCVRWALPQHYLVNQTAALRGRLRLPDDVPLPECVVRVMVCRGCGKLFDGTWTWKEATRTKPLRAERCTIRGARADLVTDRIFCDHCTFTNPSRNQVANVLLLGCALVCSRGLVLLCPQPLCGYPMVVDARCAYTQYGIACASCTLALYEHPASTSRWDKTCALCHKRAQEPRLFPCRITVCGRHVDAAVVDIFPAQPASREEGVAVLTEYAARLKAHRDTLFRGARKNQHNRMRREGRLTGRQRRFGRD